MIPQPRDLRVLTLHYDHRTGRIDDTPLRNHLLDRFRPSGERP